MNMKKIFNTPKFIISSFGLMIITLGLCVTSCTETIDDSAYYTFTGEMMTDYFNNNPEQFSMFSELLQKVHSSKKSKSTMKDLLSARGHYTCFAPNNEAIKQYLLENNTTMETIPDSLAQSIVFNSIIDHGDSESAYPATSFVDGALSRTNMNDRYITTSFSVDSTTMTTVTYVNTNSKIVAEGSVEVVNGYVHQIDKVLSPSTSSIADMIYDTENLTLFAKFLKQVGLDETLLLYKDADYEDGDTAGLTGHLNSRSGFEGTFPEHRYFGYTVFTEPDECFRREGITDLQTLRDYVRNVAAYPEDTDWEVYAEGDSHYQNANNWLYKFITYHIVPAKLTWNRLVVFSNEKGFYNGSPNDGTKFQTNVWEYYETLSPERNSIKITGIRDGKRINRMSIYDTQKYKEVTTGDEKTEMDGLNNKSNLDIALSADNGLYSNNALNGFYYPIDKILIWTDDVPNKILNERQRYDICSLLPELMSNNHRRMGDATHRAWYYPTNYFDTQNNGSGTLINVSKETKLIYLTNTQNAGTGGYQAGWIDYQADEFNIQGIYDFVMKLPPVPTSGLYEIRYGTNSNTLRGMAQIYIGTNPDNLPAIGIPIDLRVGGVYADGSQNPAIGWLPDSELDSDEDIEELDKQLRNKDYMKGPKYFYCTSSTSGRDAGNCLRKIIYRGQLDAGKTYYIRFKSVLESSTSEFFFDYLEFVPKKIYNGEGGLSGDEPEDKW